MIKMMRKMMIINIVITLGGVEDYVVWYCMFIDCTTKYKIISNTNIVLFWARILGKIGAVMITLVM